MPDVVIRIEGDESIRRALSDPNFVRGPLKTFLAKAGFIVEKNIKEIAPVDTGRLRSSVVTNLQPLRVGIGPTVFYAPFVEFGTRPHWAPQGALQLWAGRHGFPSGPLGDFLVRRAIARRGTRAQPFVAPAARRSLPEIKNAAKDLLDDIRRRWMRRAV